MTQEALKLALDLATMHHTDVGYAELRAKVRSAIKETLADYAMRETQRLGQEIEQAPVPPPWWPAVENILTEYGLQAIDFVADFKNALAQPEQEPVAWPCLIDSADFSENTITLVMQCENYKVSAGTHYLSTTPPQRTWVGLNDDEIDYLIHLAYTGDEEFVQTIEAKLKEKNT